MPVDSQTRQAVDALAASDCKPVAEPALVEARSRYERMIETRGIESEPLAGVENRAFPEPAGGYVN